jgi:hypothetical protein
VLCTLTGSLWGWDVLAFRPLLFCAVGLLQRIKFSAAVLASCVGLP